MLEGSTAAINSYGMAIQLTVKNSAAAQRTIIAKLPAVSVNFTARFPRKATPVKVLKIEVNIYLFSYSVR